MLKMPDLLLELEIPVHQSKLGIEILPAGVKMSDDRPGVSAVVAHPSYKDDLMLC